MILIGIVRKVLKTLKVVTVTLVVILCVCFLIFYIISPGKLEPLTDKEGRVIPNSISVRGETEIGSIPQVYFIRGEKPENPVMLFLHAGPGNPELPFIISRETEERLEKYFTVCYWEQRGAGASYNKAIDPATMSVERLVEDAHEMTLYLKKRFNQDKIYLIGHSWGTYLGIKTIEKYPEDYLAYFGIGQMSDQRESELLAYDYMLKHAQETGDKKSIMLLKKFDRNAPDFPGMDYEMVRAELMEKHGVGTMRNNSSINTLVKDVLLFKGYTVSEKLNYPKASWFSVNHLLPAILKDDLSGSSRSFQVPVYFLHGKYDYQVSYSLAQKYFELIEAPQKEFFTFENSAHSPNMEEPEKFVQIIRDIDARLSSDK